jgi:predicted N-acyltransferase
MSQALAVEVVDGLPAEWPRLAAGGPLFATPSWLHTMKGRLDGRVITFVVRRGGRAVLAAYASVQTAHRPGELFDLHQVLVAAGPELPLTEGARSLRTALAAAAPPPQRWLPNLLVMLPGYECTPVGPLAGDLAAAAALVDGATSWAAANGIPTVAMLYTRPEATALGAALARRGFVAAPLTPAWDLRLPGSGLADYFAGLPHKRRIEARRELRLLDDAGVRIEPVDAAAVFEDLVRLRCHLVTKYRGRERDPAAVLGHEREKLRSVIDDIAGGRPRVLLATADDGIPLGFALFAEHGQAWHCLAVGSDYDDPRSRLTYFATAYYRAAELAYGCGVRTLSYGIGAWQAKRARGCRPTPLTGWLHTCDQTLDTVARTSARITTLVT